MCCAVRCTEWRGYFAVFCGKGGKGGALSQYITRKNTFAPFFFFSSLNFNKKIGKLIPLSMVQRVLDLASGVAERVSTMLLAVSLIVCFKRYQQ